MRNERVSDPGPFEPFIFTRKGLKTIHDRSNRVSFSKIRLLSTRRLAQNLREIRMPADLANRFFANITLLNAKKRAPNSSVLGGAKRHESDRTDRAEPRVRKRRPKEYNLMSTPRDVLRKALLGQ